MKKISRILMSKIRRPKDLPETFKNFNFEERKEFVENFDKAID